MWTIVETVEYIRKVLKKIEWNIQSNPLTPIMGIVAENVVWTVLFFIYSLHYITNIDLCHALNIDPNDIWIEVMLLFSIHWWRLQIVYLC